MKKILALGIVLACAPAMVIAQEKPTSAEVKKVLDYYFQGRGQSAILVESKLCQRVSEQGETKNECVVEMADARIAKGKDAYLWMNFLVPAGDQANILVQYSRMDRVRDTSTVSLRAATRYRTWKKIPTSTVGDWKVNIVQEMDGADVDVGQMEFSIVEDQQ